MRFNRGPTSAAGFTDECADFTGEDRFCVGRPFRAAAALPRGAPAGKPAAGPKPCPTREFFYIIEEMLREAPALAVRLLNWFPYLRQNPALEGDLLELFAAGKSQAWYWRQAFAIICAGMLRNLQEFREYLAAMCIGWAAQAAIVLCLVRAGLPRENHGLIAVGSALLVWLAPYFVMVHIRERVVGRTS
jgi:hypothetical protein